VLAAGALVVVLAVAGLAAVALTSRGHSGGGPTPPASSAVAGPKAVVKAYFAAINAHSWRKVWNLGGKNFSHTYREMIAGYRGTSRDVLTHIAAHGDGWCACRAPHQRRRGDLPASYWSGTGDHLGRATLLSTG
jgi:hypothetical protein